MNNDFVVGIQDYSVYLPEKKITAKELSNKVNIPENILKEKMGIYEKYLGGKEDHPGMMGTKAAKAVLAKADVDPKEIDMILYAGETYAEYVCWTVAIKIQNEIGASNAFAWDLSFRCAGTPLALKVAKDMMRADEELKTVLVVGGNANAYLVDYEDPLQSFMFDMSPAGFALILKRDYPENELLESGIITDSVFCDDVIGMHGGTLHPITDEIGGDSEKLAKAKKLTLPDPEGMKARLGERSIPNFVGAVKKALDKSRKEAREIDFIGINHIYPKAHYMIMDTLGIEKEKTHYLSHHGHCGHADQLLALDLGRREGKVKDGDLVALLGAGTGYGFACSLIRWGKKPAGDIC